MHIGRADGRRGATTGRNCFSDAGPEEGRKSLQLPQWNKRSPRKQSTSRDDDLAFHRKVTGMMTPIDPRSDNRPDEMIQR
jgi:hypothetical protein